VILFDYLGRMRGTTRGRPPRVSVAEIFWSWVGAFSGIAAVGWAGQLLFAGHDLALLIGSIGASAVLVYGAPRSPLSQPRNLIGGHLVSALIAVVGSPDVHALGFVYVLMPATLAPLILLVVAVLVNNIPRTRRYPEIWF
jgi:CBS-domain-containing membrane protein